MARHVYLLSVPGLRRQDIQRMPRLSETVRDGERATLVPSFPSVTWPVQANMLTGKLPAEHGVVANGFYWRDEQRVEMWTACNDKITEPQVWDRLHRLDRSLTSAVWFPMLSKGCGADFVCMPAPVHHPDGSESLWCYTKPTPLYGDLRDRLGHFPLQHFWGPRANIRSSGWIADSAVFAVGRYQPRFFFVYLPHLDYAAQKTGPDSPQAMAALVELDEVVGRLVDGVTAVHGDAQPLWLVASEYVIVPVDHVTYPNRVLREAGLLQVRDDGQGEQLDLSASQAWCLVDHQFSHVFVRDNDPGVIEQVRGLFRSAEGIAEVLSGQTRAKYAMNHDRSGELILISTPNSWQAYYWWLDDSHAPPFASTVDIHRKPGYDPVELFFDAASKSIPLDASLVRGSHGAPALSPAQQGVLLSSQNGVFQSGVISDTEVADIVLQQFK